MENTKPTTSSTNSNGMDAGDLLKQMATELDATPFPALLTRVSAPAATLKEVINENQAAHSLVKMSHAVSTNGSHQSPTETAMETSTAELSAMGQISIDKKSKTEQTSNKKRIHKTPYKIRPGRSSGI